MSTTERKLSALMRDYGYRVSGNDIISVGISGFTADNIFGRCRSVFDAADLLIPIINDSEYSWRFHQITNP